MISIVIIIAMVVIKNFTDFSILGGNTNYNSDKAKLMNQDVGVLKYNVNSKKTTIQIKNNQLSSIRLTDVFVNRKRCSLEKDYLIKRGDSSIISCYGIKSNEEGTKYSYEIVINYLDVDTKGYFSLNKSDLILKGKIIDGSELHTGINKCYEGNNETIQDCSTSDSEGQDGNIDGVSKEFTILNNNIIKDDHTKLLWTTNETDRINLSQAISYCSDLEQGGFSDWRLPNVFEAVTVLDLSKTESIAPEGSWVNDRYWTSTNETSNHYWFLEISDGRFNLTRTSNSAELKRVVCVRGEMKELILDDYPHKFIKAEDNTIIDRNTGFIWQKSFSEDNLTWNESIKYCSNLVLCEDKTYQGNQTQTSTCTGSSIKYSDWRLPNIFELVTLIDFESPTYLNEIFDSIEYIDIYDSIEFWSSSTIIKRGSEGRLLRMNESMIIESGPGNAKGLNWFKHAKCIR